jgi:TrmH family RNA methyltransferase
MPAGRGWRVAKPQAALQQVKIILCRPEEEGNIGFSLRAMKTMGLSRIAVVAAKDYDAELIRRYAVHAADLWESASIHSSLEEAIGDAGLVAGTTRRLGQHRKRFSMTPARFAGLAWERLARAAGEIAVVFGNERTGLERRELDACDIAVTIPSSDEFPSLNLSHAVQVIAYELFARAPMALSPDYEPIGREELMRMVAGMADLMASIGFFTQGKREDMVEFLSGVYARAALSKGESDRLLSLTLKIAALARKAPEPLQGLGP